MNVANLPLTAKTAIRVPSRKPAEPLVSGGPIVCKTCPFTGQPTVVLTTLGQARKPPSTKALGRARSVVPFLIRSF